MMVEVDSVSSRPAHCLLALDSSPLREDGLFLSSNCTSNFFKGKGRIILAFLKSSGSIGKLKSFNGLDCGDCSAAGAGQILDEGEDDRHLTPIVTNLTPCFLQMKVDGIPNPLVVLWMRARAALMSKGLKVQGQGGHEGRILV